MARHCPNCGKAVERGETRCENCGEPLAVGPLGETSADSLLWAGRLVAVGALILPLAAIGAALLGLSLWAVHDNARDGLQTITSAAIFGIAGYAIQGGFLLL